VKEVEGAIKTGIDGIDNPVRLVFELDDATLHSFRFGP